MVSTYLSYRMYTQDLTKSLQRTASEVQVSREAKYYAANIGKVKSVDEFLKNYRLYTYAMKAYGLEDMAYAKAFMKKVLDSDLTDEKSFANKLTDKRYAEFAKAFQFKTDGTLANTAVIQSGDQEEETIGLYTQRNTNASASTTSETTYYKNNIDAVTTVDALINDNHLFAFALEAVGLDPAMTSKAAVKSALTSDLSDPNSVANLLGGDFLELAKSYNFATDGTVAAGNAQSAAKKANTISAYGSRSGAGLGASAVKLRTLYYENNITKITSVDQLLKDKTLTDYMLTAYGIDPATVSTDTVKRVLESDLSDPNSYVNKLKNGKFQNLVAAFNIATDGKVTTRRLAQSLASATDTATRYVKAAIKVDPDYKDAATTEATYYSQTIGGVRSIDELLDDKRLFAFVVNAYGLGAKTTAATLRKVLTSDLTDPLSYANKQVDAKWREVAAAFNFGTDGTIDREPAQQAQSKFNALTTAGNYVRQTMEAEAGDSNEGVRLALYFARKAPELTDVYGILADKALLSVVQTALGIATETSAADIDIQAKMIKKRLDVADLKDPKKLEKFLVRFCALYDQANTESQAQSSTAILFGNNSDTLLGFDQTAIFNFQSSRHGR